MKKERYYTVDEYGNQRFTNRKSLKYNFQQLGVNSLSIFDATTDELIIKGRKYPDGTIITIEKNF